MSRDEVDDGIIDADVQHDVGKGLAKARQDRLDVILPAKTPGMDANAAKRPLGKLVHLIERKPHLAEQGAHSFQGDALRPASNATLRVLRLNKRTPRRSSRFRIVWLTDDGAVASLSAAREKLPHAATASKAYR